MEKTTLGQLPGIQKFQKILQLEELITTHKRFSALLQAEFDALYLVPLPSRAARIQTVCEWHISQAAILEVELLRLQSS